MLRIFQTSDVHIGAKLNWLGEKSNEHRRQLLTAFEKSLSLAKKKSTDLFLIAGDLFDTPFVSKTTKSYVTSLLTDVLEAGMHVVILPGNHDRLEDGSVFNNFGLSHPKLFIFNSDSPNVFHIDILSTSIFGIGISAKNTTANFNNLVKFKYKNKKHKLNIALHHGGFDINKNSKQKNLLTTEQIHKSGFDYLALGDWHGFLDVSTPNTKAFYSGSPELLASDQKNSGNVLEILIQETGQIDVEKHQVGEFSAKNLEINIGDYPSEKMLTTAILNQLKINKDKKCVLNLDLTGIQKINTKINTAELYSLFAKDFYKLNIKDKSKVSLKDDEIEQLAESLIVSKFVKKLKKEMRTEKDPTQKEFLEEVLKMGLTKFNT